jgi:hypothetical protein
MPTSTLPSMLGLGSRRSSSWLNRCFSSSNSISSTEGLRRSMSKWRILFMLEELRWLSGDEVRVRGEVVPMDDEGEMDRPERLGENAVRRRWREPVGMGVKGDWKRLVRVGVTILAVGLLECW